jgi:flagellar motor switch protein FliM
MNEDRAGLVAMVQHIDRMHSKLVDYGVKVESDHAVQLDSLHESVDVLQTATALALRQAEEMKGTMLTSVERNIANYNETLLGVLGRLNSDEYVDTELSPSDTLIKLNTLGTQLAVVASGLERSIGYENQFKNVETGDRRNLDETQKIFEYRQDYWSRVEAWKTTEQNWPIQFSVNSRSRKY